MSVTPIDAKRSERFGEPIPIASERLRMHREGIEHIDVIGQLKVPCASPLDRAPEREGWEARFVAVNLNGWPSGHKKWVTYRRLA